jgi:ferredoxin--NADP+ reductase
MSNADKPDGPVLPQVQMHLARPNEPVIGRVTKNEICTASRKAAGYVRHVEFDVSGTPLAGACYPGQAIGVIAPGEDEKGRPHAVRLYSLASPRAGEDGKGAILSTTVKRTIDEHWETNRLFLGVASNYLCDAQEGDELRLSGPAGKRFLLPTDQNAHSYIMFATGTGIAPFRGMVLDLLRNGCTKPVVLIMGSPYSTDLIYHDQFLSLAGEYPNFTYLTAISRERQDDGHDRMYVQDRLSTNREELLPVLANESTLVYVCGLAGMELGIFREMSEMLNGDALERYVHIDPEVLDQPAGWTRKMVNRQIKPTHNMMLEVYA